MSADDGKLFSSEIRSKLARKAGTFTLLTKKCIALFTVCFRITITKVEIVFPLHFFPFQPFLLNSHPIQFYSLHFCGITHFCMNEFQLSDTDLKLMALDMYSRDKKGTYPYYISPIEIGLL